MKKNQESALFNYFVTFFVIALSGIQIFDGNPFLMFLLFLLLIVAKVSRKKRYDPELLVWTSLIFLIIIIQSALFASINLASVLGVLLTYAIVPYLVVKVLGLRFFSFYLDIIFIFATISLVFWFGSNFISGFFDLTVTLAQFFKPFTYQDLPVESFIIYNVEYQKISELYRNAGQFHEPGAFAVFLSLALIINLAQTKNFFDKKAVVILLAMITTFSTAGYLAIIVYFSIYFFQKRKDMFVRVVYAFLLIPLSIFIYNQEFVGEKLEDHYYDQSITSINAGTSGRILGARKALIVIERFPLFGRGLSASTRANPYSEEAAGYGTITWISMLGLPAGLLFLFYFVMFFKSLVRDTAFSSTYLLLALTVLFTLAGQKHTSTYVFLGVFFAGYVFKREDYLQFSNPTSRQ